MVHNGQDGAWDRVEKEGMSALMQEQNPSQTD